MRQLMVFGQAARTPSVAVSLAVVVLMLAAAIVVPWLGLPAPDVMAAPPFLPPGKEHWLGTDNYGRDVLARLIWGARTAIAVAIGSSLLSTAIGVAFGAVAGFYGGWSDAVLSRAFDVFLLIPTFFLVLVMVSLFGASLGFTMVAIGITTWPRSGRIMRSQVLTLKTRTYVQAAIAAGASHGQALRRHVIPNGLAPLVTDGTLLMGLAILTEAGLSFLGLGDQNTISWGRMIYEGQRYLRFAPWLSIFPGLSMLVLVLALNLLGDGLNLALNPQLRRRGTAPRSLRRVAFEPAPASSTGPLLEVEDLRLVYRAGRRELHAVDGVSFAVARGEALGVVGESGCGKSSLTAALMQMLPANGELHGGTVRFEGQAVLRDGAATVVRGQPVFDSIRWRRAAIVFQSAMNALNPVLTIRQQLTEAFLLHRPDAKPLEAETRIAALFSMIDIPPARLSAYPHELSGGMLQRVMIALALLLEPALLIADEPTTALDVLTQGQILAEIGALRRRMDLTLILISHDIGVVAETCDRIAVMYAGEFVEIAPTEVILSRPCHPYTRALIAASPSLFGPKRRLATIPGDAFVATVERRGCRFAPRCPRAEPRCRDETPGATQLAAGHLAACHFAAEFANTALEPASA